MIEISQVLVFLFTSPFSGWLQRRIYNRAFSAEILNGFKLSTNFAEKAPSQMCEWVKNRFLAKGLKY